MVEDEDDGSHDNFNDLKTTEPVIILNPCQLTQPEFAENMGDNLMLMEFERTNLHLKADLVQRVVIGFPDKTQQRRKHMIIKQFAPNFGGHKTSVSNESDLSRRKTSWLFTSKKSRKFSAINGTSEGLLATPLSPQARRPLI